MNDSTVTAYAAGSIAGFAAYTKPAVHFTTNHAEGDEYRDVFVSPVLGSVQRTKIYPVAKNLPPYNEAVHIYGYPMHHPKLIAHAKLIHQQCYYKGPVAVVLTPSRGYIHHLLKCPYMKWVQGASGGPVINQRGEALGTISSAFHASKVIPFGGSTLIIFASLVEDDLVSDPEVVAGHRRIPRLEGERYYPQAWYPSDALPSPWYEKWFKYPSVLIRKGTLFVYFKNNKLDLEEKDALVLSQEQKPDEDFFTFRDRVLDDGSKAEP